MAELNINSEYCYNCTFSDAYGRDCEINSFMPVLLAMKGFDSCPKFQRKNTEQIENQLKIKGYE